MVSWSRDKIAKWVATVDEFQRYLVVITYLVGGQPPRGTEIAAFLCSNSEGERRTVLFHEGSAVFSQGYSKQRSATGRDRPAVRLLDDKTSQLYLAFLVVVKPLYNFLLTKAPLAPGRQSPPNPHHLFVTQGVRWTGDSVSAAFKELVPDFLWRGHGLSTLRQGLDALAKAELPRHLVLSTLEETMVAVVEQAGHSAQTAAMRYGVDEDSPGGVDPMMFLQSHAASTLWHEALGLSSLKHPAFREHSTDFTTTPSLSKVPSTRRLPRGFEEAGGAEGPFHQEWAPAPQAARAPQLEEGEREGQDILQSTLPPLRLFSPYTCRPPPVLSKAYYETILSVFRRASGNPAASFRSTQQALAFSQLLHSSGDGVIVLETGGGQDPHSHHCGLRRLWAGYRCCLPIEVFVGDVLQVSKLSERRASG